MGYTPTSCLLVRSLYSTFYHFRISLNIVYQRDVDILLLPGQLCGPDGGWLPGGEARVSLGRLRVLRPLHAHGGGGPRRRCVQGGEEDELTSVLAHVRQGRLSKTNKINNYLHCL